jgi:hypothetical protein
MARQITASRALMIVAATLYVLLLATTLTNIHLSMVTWVTLFLVASLLGIAAGVARMIERDRR